MVLPGELKQLLGLHLVSPGVGRGRQRTQTMTSMLQGDIQWPPPRLGRIPASDQKRLAPSRLSARLCKR